MQAEREAVRREDTPTPDQFARMKKLGIPPSRAYTRSEAERVIARAESERAGHARNSAARTSFSRGMRLIASEGYKPRWVGPSGWEWFVYLPTPKTDSQGDTIEYYAVNASEGRASCSCAGFHFRDYCAHWFAIRKHLGLIEERKTT